MRVSVVLRRFHGRDQRLAGQLRPLQRTTIVALRGARTEKSEILAPLEVSVPRMRTTGNGRMTRRWREVSCRTSPLVGTGVAGTSKVGGGAGVGVGVGVGIGVGVAVGATVGTGVGAGVGAGPTVLDVIENRSARPLVPGFCGWPRNA